jgi:hypothetical protein
MMSKSQIFYTEMYKGVEKAIVTFLNSQPDFLSTRTAESTRTVGDAIQTILSEQIQPLLGDLDERLFWFPCWQGAFHPFA